MEAQPYTPDEQRVASWLVKLHDGLAGAGDDPIGFVLASHEALRHERDIAVNALRKIVSSFDDDGPFIAEEALKEID